MRRIEFPQNTECGESFPQKPAEQRLFPRVAIHFRDGFCKRNALGASVNAVLRIGAFLNAAGAHQRLQALALIHRARGVHVEETHLADDSGTHELIVLVHLWTDFKAVTASDAIRKRIPFFLNFGRHARALAEVVGAINGDPGFHALEAFKHKLPVDSKIAHERKLC